MIDELNELSRRLQSLLRDPHPGLATWRIALAGVLADIARYAPGKGV